VGGADQGEQPGWPGIKLGYVLQVGDAFAALLDGRLSTTALTTPVLPILAGASPGD
jgi:hypothetical protein